MDAVPEHLNPVGMNETLATLRKGMRMPVPSAAGHIIDLRVVAIYETTAVNGQPLSLLISARKTVNDPVKQFGVIFSKYPPDWHNYDIPVLWREDGRAGLGRWK